MKTYLFVYSIGPVQSFIAAARKTEDFWSGSYLLSFLTERTIEFALQLESFNAKVLSPGITLAEIEESKRNPSEVASLPNRFLMRIEAESDEDVRQFGIQLEEITKQSFIKLGNRAFKNVFPSLSNHVYITNLINKQLTNLLEIFWAFEQWDTNVPGTYNEVRTTVEKRLASVKNNRTFAETAQDGLVCTVCGMREALNEGNINEHYSIGKMRHVMKQTWAKRARKYQETEEDKGARIKDNERLCAVCLTKRLTREVILEQNNAVKTRFDSFPSVVEFLTDKDKNPYYAIIMMDGDDMGKWLSGVDGKILPSFDKVTEDYHQEFSRRLTIFSKEKVPKIVEKPATGEKKYTGKLIYAGGDDVLAFTTLADLLDTAQNLRKAFSADDVLGKNATSSMGIVIAHYKEPLQKVIRTAQRMEATAKQYRNNYQEKDALAIALISNSGQTREMTIPWYLDADKNESVIDVMKELENALGKHLSSTFLYHFNEAFAPLVHRDKKPDVSKAMIESELRRLINRATNNKAITEPLIRKLLQMYDLTDTFKEYIHLLETVRFISSKLKDTNKEGVV